MLPVYMRENWTCHCTPDILLVHTCSLWGEIENDCGPVGSGAPGSSDVVMMSHPYASGVYPFLWAKLTFRPNPGLFHSGHRLQALEFSPR